MPPLTILVSSCSIQATILLALSKLVLQSTAEIKASIKTSCEEKPCFL